MFNDFFCAKWQKPASFRVFFLHFVWDWKIDVIDRNSNIVACYHCCISMRLPSNRFQSIISTRYVACCCHHENSKFFRSNWCVSAAFLRSLLFGFELWIEKMHSKEKARKELRQEERPKRIEIINEFVGILKLLHVIGIERYINVVLFLVYVHSTMHQSWWDLQRQWKIFKNEKANSNQNGIKKIRMKILNHGNRSRVNVNEVLQQ